jgi:hypothetical protein
VCESLIPMSDAGAISGSVPFLDSVFFKDLNFKFQKRKPIGLRFFYNLSLRGEQRRSNLLYKSRRILINQRLRFKTCQVANASPLRNLTG